MAKKPTPTQLRNEKFEQDLEQQMANNLRRPMLRAALRKTFTKPIRDSLYKVSRSLGGKVREELGVYVDDLHAYIQDPKVARKNPELGVLPFRVIRDPSIGDGPRSARFAVVDYNMDSASLTPAAEWNTKARRFESLDGEVLDEHQKDSFQFHQTNVWAVAQTALDYFEDAYYGMGRPIPWAFEGNRLILVPHAGYGENAFYDRHSKSLQFYYLGDEEAPTYTCLSHDIIAHETGHALLDGIRPLYFDFTSVETAAFHEFVGDLTALLLILRRKEVRKHVAVEADGDLRKDEVIARLAEEFGTTIDGSDALRNAHDKLTMAQMRARGIQSPHTASRVLTTAMFEILIRMANVYRSGITDDGNHRKMTASAALGHAAVRFGRIALRPIDMCPPMDIRFLDYARAVVHTYETNEPGDAPRLQLFRRVIRDVFHEWGLCRRAGQVCEAGGCDLNVGKNALRTRLSSSQHIIDVSRSRTAAYYYINDNRKLLNIPPHQDVEIVDLYGLSKFGRAGRRLPREIVIEYLWREEYELEGKDYGDLQGEIVELLCGGTLVLDEYGNVISFFNKPGLESPGRDVHAGKKRWRQLQAHYKRQVQTGQVGLRGGSEVEILGSWSPPIVADRRDGTLRLEITPHVRETFDPKGQAPKKTEPEKPKLWDEGEDTWTTSF